MRRLRVPLTALLMIFVVLDVVVGYRLLESGWPKHISLMSTQKGVEQVQVMPVPFTGSDWLILALATGIHAGLFYTVWKAWNASSSRV